MQPTHRFLFNFAASFSGGGYKRLYEYAQWFNSNGGAWFIIHPDCAALATEFPNNRCFVVKPSRLQRLLADCGYLAGICRQIGQPDLYYSYGIPVYSHVGRVNWFHLSNVLPLSSAGIPVSFYDRIRLGSLGRRIRRGFAHCEVISAESAYSLGLVGSDAAPRLFLSVNGSDDELAYIQNASAEAKDNYAVVIGTYGHKAIRDSVAVFEMLRARNPGLKLMIVGIAEAVAADLRSKPDVVMRGVLGRPAVIACLRRARFYISTTLIENSYNAAAEGIFIADESYISDIGPHRELLQGSRFEETQVPGVERRLLRVRREHLSPGNLKTWDTVVREMIGHFRKVIDRNEH